MNSIAFARHLFLLRRDHRMTIEDLASAMEVTPEMICEWECAKKSPTLDQINRLAKIYGMPLSDLIQSPKPVKPAPAPEEASAQEPQPVAPEQGEEQKEPTEEYTPKRGKKKKKPAVWEILIIVLLLLIIGASLTFLIKPEWFPFLQYLGS